MTSSRAHGSVESRMSAPSVTVTSSADARISDLESQVAALRGERNTWMTYSRILMASDAELADPSRSYERIDVIRQGRKKLDALDHLANNRLTEKLQKGALTPEGADSEQIKRSDNKKEILEKAMRRRAARSGPTDNDGSDPVAQLKAELYSTSPAHHVSPLLPEKMLEATRSIEERNQNVKLHLVESLWRRRKISGVFKAWVRSIWEYKVYLEHKAELEQERAIRLALEAELAKLKENSEAIVSQAQAECATATKAMEAEREGAVTIRKNADDKIKAIKAELAIREAAEVEAEAGKRDALLRASGLERDLKDALEEKRMLEGALEETRQTLSSVQDELQSASEQLTVAELNSVDPEELSQVRTELENANKNLDEARALISTLENQLLENETTTIPKEEAETSLSNLEAEVDQECEKRVAVEQELEKVNDSMRDIQGAREEEKQRLEDEKALLQDQISAKEDALQDALIKLERLRSSTVPKPEYEDLVRRLEEYRSNHVNLVPRSDLMQATDEKEAVVRSLAAARANITELEQQLADKENEIQKCNDAILKAEQDRVVAQDDLKEIRQVMASSTEAKEAAAREAKLQESVDNSKKKIEALEKALQEALEEKEISQAETTSEKIAHAADQRAAEERLEEMRSSFDDLVADKEDAHHEEIAKLQQNIAEIKRDHTRAMADAAAFADAEKRVADSELESVIADLGTEKKERAKLERDVSQAREETIGVRNKLAAAKSQNEDLTTKLETLQMALDNAEQTSRDLEGSLSEEMQQLRDANAELRREVRDLQLKLVPKSNLDALEKELDALKDMTEFYEKTYVPREELEKALDEKVAAEDRAHDLEKELTALEKSMEILKESTVPKEQLEDSENARIEGERIAAAEARELRKEIESYQESTVPKSDLDTAEAKLKRLETENKLKDEANKKELARQTHAAEALKNKMKDLVPKSELERLKKEVTTAKEREKEARDANKDLDAELRKSQTALRDLQRSTVPKDELRAAQDEKRQISGELKELQRTTVPRNDLKNLERDLEAARRSEKASKALVDEMKDELRRLRTENEKQRDKTVPVEEVEDLRADIRKLEEDLRTKDAESAVLHEEIDRLKDKMEQEKEETAEQLAAEKEKNQAEKKKLIAAHEDEVATENARAADRIQKLKDDCESRLKAKDDILREFVPRGELESLQKELEAIQEDLADVQAQLQQEKENRQDEAAAAQALQEEVQTLREVSEEQAKKLSRAPDEKAKDIRRLEESAREAAKQHDRELAQAEKERVKFEADARAKEEELTAMVGKLQEQLKDISAKVEENEQELHAYRGHDTVSRGEYTALQDDCEKLKADLHDLLEELEESRENEKLLVEEVEELSKQLTGWQNFCNVFSDDSKSPLKMFTSGRL